MLTLAFSATLSVFRKNLFIVNSLILIGMRTHAFIMPQDDGTNPPMEMCREFIDLADRVIRDGGTSRGLMPALHCMR